MTARRFVLTEVKKVYYNNICGKYYLPNLGRICEKRGHNVPMLLLTFNTTRILTLRLFKSFMIDNQKFALSLANLFLRLQPLSILRSE